MDNVWMEGCVLRVFEDLRYDAAGMDGETVVVGYPLVFTTD